jgi:hypothetical protein
MPFLWTEQGTGTQVHGHMAIIGPLKNLLHVSVTSNYAKKPSKLIALAH